MPFSLVPASASMEVGQRQRLKARLTPKGFALFGSKWIEPSLVKWQVSNPKVVGLDEDTGELRAISPGRSAIRADFSDGDSAVAIVTVSPPAMALKLGRGMAIVGQAPVKTVPAMAIVIPPQVGQQIGALMAASAFSAAIIGAGHYAEKEIGKKR